VNKYLPPASSLRPYAVVMCRSFHDRVAERGAELQELERVGVDAVLVGEALMRSADIADAVRVLLDQT
jgi:hypothetical protein